MEESKSCDYAFPALLNNRILRLATSFMTSRAGPKIFRGSNSFGESAKTSRTDAVKTNRKSVSMLTFAMPSAVAFLARAQDGIFLFRASLLHARKFSQFSLNADAFRMRRVDNALCQRRVFVELQEGTINHH
jgi:hypothetical protein